MDLSQQRSGPTKLETCVYCQVKFVAGPSHNKGRRGKQCPAGHFNTTYELKVGHPIVRVQKEPKPPKPAKVIPAISEDEQVMREALKHVTKLSHMQEVEVALQWMVMAYDKLKQNVQPHPIMKVLVEGAFENIVPLAREILEHGRLRNPKTRLVNPDPFAQTKHDS